MNEFRCDICGNNDYKKIYNKKSMHPLWWTDEFDSIQFDLNYVICNQCGYITHYPRLEVDIYEKYYKIVPPLNNYNSDIKYNALMELRKNFISGLIDPKQINRAIEIGPSNSNLLSFIPSEEKIAIEASKALCDYYNTLDTDIKFHCGMLENVEHDMPQLLESADLVIASHVLEHAQNPSRFVLMLTALLKPLGYVYIEVPSVEALADCGKTSHPNLHFAHISQFSISVLNRLCISLFLTPIKVEIGNEENCHAIRALYQLMPKPIEIQTLFLQQCMNTFKDAEQAKQVLLREIKASDNRVALWGCGDDLFDVFRIMDDCDLNLIKDKVILVDINKRKHNKEMFGFNINGPQALSSTIDTIIVCPGSQKIKNDITIDIISRSLNANVIYLYD